MAVRSCFEICCGPQANFSKVVVLIFICLAFVIKYVQPPDHDSYCPYMTGYYVHIAIVMFILVVTHIFSVPPKILELGLLIFCEIILVINVLLHFHYFFKYGFYHFIKKKLDEDKTYINFCMYCVINAVSLILVLSNIIRLIRTPTEDSQEAA